MYFLSYVETKLKSDLKVEEENLEQGRPSGGEREGQKREGSVTTAQHV